MRLFTVDKKTIKKNLLRFMNSERVVMGRPGPPPRVEDLHMRKWLEQQVSAAAAGVSAEGCDCHCSSGCEWRGSTAHPVV